jgi:hypothetical protein
VRIDTLAITLASSQPAPAPADVAPQTQRPDVVRPALRLVIDNG